MVHILELKDREEWLKHRSFRIGGSDASAVLGMNPYKSNVDLFWEKTGKRVPEDISDKPYVIYGTRTEPYLREMFRLDFPQYDVEYIENNMYLNDRYPFAHASLDGWITDQEGRKGILEIKTTNILQSMQKEKWKDRIPDNYYVQVLHYLMVTEFDFAVLKAQLKYEFDGEVYIQIRHYHIERGDVEEDIRMLESAERRFFEHMTKGKCPGLILPEL